MSMIVINLIIGSAIMVLFHHYGELIPAILREFKGEDKAILVRTLDKMSFLLLLWCLAISFAVGISLGSGEIIYALRGVAQLFNEHQFGVILAGAKDLQALEIDQTRYMSGLLSACLGVVVAIVYQDVRSLRKSISDSEGEKV